MAGTERADLARLIAQVESLRELLDERNGRYEERWRAQEEALRGAAQSLDSRLDSLNKFRDSLRDQTGTFITRAEYAARHESLELEVARLRERVDQATGSASATDRLRYLLIVSVTTLAGLGVLLYTVLHH